MKRTTSILTIAAIALSAAAQQGLYVAGGTGNAQ